jgi:hypothetical protein
MPSQLNNFHNEVAGLWIFLKGGIEVSPAEPLLSANLVDLSDFLKAWLAKLHR